MNIMYYNTCSYLRIKWRSVTERNKRIEGLRTPKEMKEMKEMKQLKQLRAPTPSKK